MPVALSPRPLPPHLSAAAHQGGELHFQALSRPLLPLPLPPHPSTHAAVPPTPIPPHTRIIMPRVRALAGCAPAPFAGGLPLPTTCSSSTLQPASSNDTWSGGQEGPEGSTFPRTAVTGATVRKRSSTSVGI